MSAQSNYKNHAILKVDNITYVLLKLNKAPAHYEEYHLIQFDDASQRLMRDNVTVILIESIQRKRYAPYLYDTIILLSWAISTRRLSINDLQLYKGRRVVLVNLAGLDELFNTMVQDYDDGVIDIPTIVVP